MAHRIVSITNRDGAIVEPGWLAKAESIHRELRPQIPPDYRAKMHLVFAGGGRMAVAVDGDTVVASRFIGYTKIRSTAASSIATIW